ncbi:NmrA family transcriptional regulator, partial [Endobacter medicaginis]
RVVAAFAQAIAVGRPGRVIALSSVGAQVARFNLLNNAGLLEAGLAGAGVPVAMLRPAWFIENVQWDVMAARAGRIESYLAPLGRGIEMVSVRDIGRVAAGLLREEWRGCRVVELRGPEPVSPQVLASAFGRALDRPVAVTAVPRGDWEARFRAQGMQHPQARMAMLDGFNEGWIGFEGAPAGCVMGVVGVETVVADLLARG